MLSLLLAEDENFFRAAGDHVAVRRRLFFTIDCLSALGGPFFVLQSAVDAPPHFSPFSFVFSHADFPLDYHNLV